MMEGETIKEDGARTLSSGNSGNQSAVKVSTSERKNTCSPFVHTGKCELSGQALRITYESFKKNHVVYIGMTDLNELMRSRFAPAAPVKELRLDPDGVEISVKIGYACRTVSGKALKVNTSTSGGDLILPWSSLEKIWNHKVNSAPISRIRDGCPTPPAVPCKPITEGLARGF